MPSSHFLLVVSHPPCRDHAIDMSIAYRFLKNGAHRTAACSTQRSAWPLCFLCPGDHPILAGQVAHSFELCSWCQNLHRRCSVSILAPFSPRSGVSKEGQPRGSLAGRGMLLDMQMSLAVLTRPAKCTLFTKPCRCLTSHGPAPGPLPWLTLNPSCSIRNIKLPGTFWVKFAFLLS